MPTLQGRFKVPQWDAKSEGNGRFEEPGVPTTHLLTPFHWEAWMSGLAAPQPAPDGVLTVALPLGDALLPGIAAENIGRCAYGLFRGGEEFQGPPSGSPVSPSPGAARAWPVAGVRRSGAVPAAAARSVPLTAVPGIDVASNMIPYVAEANDEYCRSRDVQPGQAAQSFATRVRRLVARPNTHIGEGFYHGRRAMIRT